MAIGSLTSENQIQARPSEFKQQEQATQQSVSESAKNRLEYRPVQQEKVIIKAIQTANKKFDDGTREFEFTIHEKTKQIMIKVINTTTKEVIREVPPEKILDMVANMCEAAGLFVDEKR